MRPSPWPCVRSTPTFHGSRGASTPLTELAYVIGRRKRYDDIESLHTPGFGGDLRMWNPLKPPNSHLSTFKIRGGNPVNLHEGDPGHVVHGPEHPRGPG